jgi:hypothetical protein
VTLAVLTGVPHTVWASDPAAMASAQMVLERISKARK